MPFRSLGVGALTVSAPAMARISDDVVKIGVLTDMSSLYADINGPGAVVATQMAVEDFGGTVLGKKIEVIQADVQNKAERRRRHCRPLVRHRAGRRDPRYRRLIVVTRHIPRRRRQEEGLHRH